MLIDETHFFSNHSINLFYFIFIIDETHFPYNVLNTFLKFFLNNFYMLILYIGYTLQFYIKNYHNDIYMCDKAAGDAGRIITPCSRSYGLDFKATSNKYGYTSLTHSETDNVFEVQDDDQVLVYGWDKGEPNQQFLIVLVSPSTFIIKNQDLCLEYLPEEKKYIATECSGQGNQLFNILGHKDDDKVNKAKNALSFNRNKGFPIYGDSESTYTSACLENGHCFHRKRRIHDKS
jgi:hypothetical protein